MARLLNPFAPVVDFHPCLKLAGVRRNRGPDAPLVIDLHETRFVQRNDGSLVGADRPAIELAGVGCAAALLHKVEEIAQSSSSPVGAFSGLYRP